MSLTGTLQTLLINHWLIAGGVLTNSYRYVTINIQWCAYENKLTLLTINCVLTNGCLLTYNDPQDVPDRFRHGISHTHVLFINHHVQSGLCCTGAQVPKVTNFCLWRLEKLTFFISLQCWTSRTWWLGMFGLLVIFLRLQPWQMNP